MSKRNSAEKAMRQVIHRGVKTCTRSRSALKRYAVELMDKAHDVTLKLYPYDKVHDAKS